MHFLKRFNILASIFFFYPLQEEKLSKLREMVPTSTPEEKVAEESQVQGLSQKQHFLQYVRAAAELGETLLLGEDAAKQPTTKALEYLRGAAHLQEAAWRMMGAGYVSYTWL